MEVELESLRQTVQAQIAQVDQLVERIRVVSKAEAELRLALEAAHRQHRHKRELTDRLQTQLRDAAEVSAREREHIRHLTARVEELLQEIEKMKRTRVWRLGMGYWTVGAVVRGLTRRH